jgi:hypothetical protein
MLKFDWNQSRRISRNVCIPFCDNFANIQDSDGVRSFVLPEGIDVRYEAPPFPSVAISARQHLSDPEHVTDLKQKFHFC